MRLITRGDVDGVMCAVLLKAVGLVDDMLLVLPKEMQDGIVAVSENDIVCNLPYAPGCHLWFDHHVSENEGPRQPEHFRGSYGPAPSAAHLVYHYLITDHQELARFLPLLDIIDRFDSADVTIEDMKRPEPAMLLAFLLDPRTGLGLQHSFRVSEEEFARIMADLLLEQSAEEVIEHPDVQERIDAYRALTAEAKSFYRERLQVDGNILLIDLRQESWIPPANRFLIYTLPGAERTNISVRLTPASRGRRVSVKVAHNIFNRTSTVNVGALMAEYGGGGHRGAGGCQIPTIDADQILAEILERLRE